MLSGATLEPYVQSSKELKAGTPVRVTSTKGEYVRVKVKALVEELINGTDIAVQMNGSKYARDTVVGKSRTRYKIIESRFAHVNKIFNGLLSKDSYLYWDSKVDDKKRNILFATEDFGKEFWIDKSCLKLEGDQTATFGLETSLESDSCHTYIREPYTPHERGNTFKKERELSGKPQITVTDDDGKLWYFIAESYDFEKECYQHIGYIKADDAHLELINPFVWSNFGFKMYDAGSEYVYAMKDYHKSEKTDVFIDELWKMVDEDGDGILSPGEFLRAQRNPYTSERMGKMVVKHKSEWSYDPEKIKSEALEFYKLGLDLEKDPDKKKLLEQKRDAELEHLVEKTKNLMFWTELQNTTYTPETTKKDKEYEKKKAKIDTKPIVHPDKMPEGEAKTKKQVELDAQKDALDQEYKKGEYKEETRKLPSSDMLWHFNVNSFVRQMRMMYGIKKKPQIIFPLKIKPTNDIGEKWGKNYYWGAGFEDYNQTIFKANRKGGRKHAGRDLYTKPYEEVVAVCDGEVLRVDDFYAKTHQITVKHKTTDEREFIFRYGELDPPSIKVKKGDKVKQGDTLGKTGKLIGITVISGQEIYMLHPEIYDGSEGLNLVKSLSNSTRPFGRRKDLIDPMEILREGYNNTFVARSGGETKRVNPKTLKTSNNAIEFIKDWEDFKSKAYNDIEGYCTIGYGHLIKKKKCENITLPDEFKDGITKEKATELFKERLSTFEKSIQRDIKVKLSQNEFDALVSFVFNTGEYFLTTGANGGHTKILKNINAEKYLEGAEEMRDVTNGGTLGLIKRRKAEINMFKSNIYDSTH